MSELASFLEVKLKLVSLKHPQFIGAVERSHGPLKQILKINTEEQWKDCYKYVPLATFTHNTSYHFRKKLLFFNFFPWQRSNKTS